MVAICYCCEKEIDSDNISEEHILLNAIGGKLKSKELLCKDCNSNFGDSYDNVLSSQLLFLSSFLNVKRDRGQHPTLKGGKTNDGEEIHLLAGGKPYYAKPNVETSKENGEVVLNIKARSKHELRKILKGFNKKYPQINVEQIVNDSAIQTKYLNEPVKVTQTIGGKEALNAILKTALNYAILKAKGFAHFKHVINILKSDIKNDLCKHFYPNRLYKKQAGEICHVIHVQSNRSNKNIIAYVEFFSSYSFIVLLSDSYEGKSFKSTHSYNVAANKESEKNINLKITTEDFSNLPVISPKYYSVITDKMDRVVQICLKKQQDKALSELISKCVDDIWKVKYEHETHVTEKMVQELSSHIANEFVKFTYRGVSS